MLLFFAFNVDNKSLIIYIAFITDKGSYIFALFSNMYTTILKIFSLATSLLAVYFSESGYYKTFLRFSYKKNTFSNRLYPGKYFHWMSLDFMISPST